LRRGAVALVRLNAGLTVVAMLARAGAVGLAAKPSEHAFQFRRQPLNLG
jgi:hypothetical protein